MKCFKSTNHKSPITKYTEKASAKNNREPLRTVPIENFKSENNKKYESKNMSKMKLYGQHETETSNWKILTKEAESKIYEQVPSISTPKAIK